MNILFNASVCGLGTNGGSKTIIRCAETLQKLGHDVTIWAEVNKYNWHKIEIKLLKQDDYFNYTDVEILVSAWELPLRCTIKLCNKTYWYCRGWETWIHGEEWLIKQTELFVAMGGKIICNSSWLVNRFAEYSIPSELCFSGLDLDEWGNDNQRSRTYPYYTGGMVYKRHKTKQSEMIEGVCRDERGQFIDIKSGYSNKQLRAFYNRCDMWFSPTELEGFHNVAAEANLCGCLVFCNRLDSNGMGDYATEETAMRYTGHDELLACLDKPDYSKVAKMQDVLINKIGSRFENMRRFVELIGG